ncbi:MAG: hypothetical protein GEV06_22255 [Luteitalea sp.]|nr:hypothetical protein [Luteitalea sp.]
MTYRIHRATSADEVVFTLSGEMDKDHVAGLQALLASETTRRVVLDLVDVMLVDRDAVRFLARAEAAGAILLNCPEYVRSWIAAEQGGPSHKH